MGLQSCQELLRNLVDRAVRHGPEYSWDEGARCVRCHGETCRLMPDFPRPPPRESRRTTPAWSGNRSQKPSSLSEFPRSSRSESVWQTGRERPPGTSPGSGSGAKVGGRSRPGCSSGRDLSGCTERRPRARLDRPCRPQAVQRRMVNEGDAGHSFSSPRAPRREPCRLCPEDHASGTLHRVLPVTSRVSHG